VELPRDAPPSSPGRAGIEPTIFNTDYSWIRRGPCLGCGGLVVTARDPHVLFGGRRDATALIAIDTAPQRMQGVNAESLFGQRDDVFVLGVAHRDCSDLARRRLETRAVELPDDLIPMRVTDDDSALPQLHLPPSEGFCAFCGSTDTTDEHVFAAWVSAELQKRGSLVRETEHGRVPIRSLDVTVPICSHCNNRWLSVLENDARPILAPMINGTGSFTLTSDQQKLLAAWALKTALVLDLVSGAPMIPAGFFYAFRQRREALPNTAVWIGAYLDKSAIWVDHHGIPAEKPTDFVTTFTVGRVVFHIVGMIDEGTVALPTDTPALWRLAPRYQESIAWPRDNLAFGDESLRSLASSVTAST
jgi:hypothetical protein